jgi:hypothetical protein
MCVAKEAGVGVTLRYRQMIAMNPANDIHIVLKICSVHCAARPAPHCRNIVSIDATI